MKNNAIWVAALLISGCGFAHAETALHNDSFFPWNVGDSWVYQTINKKTKDVFPMNVTIKETWKEGDQAGIIMVQKDKRGQMRQFMLKNEKGIFLEKLGLSKSFTPEVFTRFDSPVPAVIFPLIPGTKVHWEGRLHVLTVNQKIVYDGLVVGWEDVTVPAGNFHCIKIHFHEMRDKDVVDEDAWYAENVGQVKYDGGQYIKELKSFKVQ